MPMSRDALAAMNDVRGTISGQARGRPTCAEGAPSCVPGGVGDVVDALPQPTQAASATVSSPSFMGYPAYRPSSTSALDRRLCLFATHPVARRPHPPLACRAAKPRRRVADCYPFGLKRYPTHGSVTRYRG